MIQWTKFDANNPPSEENKYLVCTKHGDYLVAEIWIWEDVEGFAWAEADYGHEEIHDVTHYAVINNPAVKGEETK